MHRKVAAASSDAPGGAGGADRAGSRSPPEKDTSAATEKRRRSADATAVLLPLRALLRESMQHGEPWFSRHVILFRGMTQVPIIIAGVLMVTHMRGLAWEGASIASEGVLLLALSLFFYTRPVMAERCSSVVNRMLDFECTHAGFVKGAREHVAVELFVLVVDLAVVAALAIVMVVDERAEAPAWAQAVVAGAYGVAIVVSSVSIKCSSPVWLLQDGAVPGLIELCAAATRRIEAAGPREGGGNGVARGAGDKDEAPALQNTACSQKPAADAASAGQKTGPEESAASVPTEHLEAGSARNPPAGTPQDQLGNTSSPPEINPQRLFAPILPTDDNIVSSAAQVAAEIELIASLLDDLAAFVTVDACMSLFLPVADLPVVCAVAAQWPRPSALIVVRTINLVIWLVVNPFVSYKAQHALDALPAALAARALAERRAGRRDTAREFGELAADVQRMELGWTWWNVKVTSTLLSYFRATMIPAMLAIVWQAGQDEGEWFWSQLGIAQLGGAP